MTYAELLQQYFERSNALQSYWTLYVVIAGGLLAFSSLRQKPDAITGILVSVLFCMFAYKNCGAIGDATHQRLAIHAQLLQSNAIPTVHQESDAQHTSITPSSIQKEINPTLNPPAWEGVRNFHIISDVLVVLTLWAMELRRVRAARRAAVTPTT